MLSFPNLNITLAICGLLLSGCLYGQSIMYTNNWSFGSYAGLTFNTFPPSPVAGSPMYTVEGTSSASNAVGTALFYTDGTRVYTASNTIMPNGSGLSGHTSSTQSAIVVPNPGNAREYYIFTTSASASVGVTYSVVDMALNGGLGDVKSTQKNISLTNSTTEKICAVKHPTVNEYWVIMHESANTTFRTFRVSASGVVAGPSLL